MKYKKLKGLTQEYLQTLGDTDNDKDEWYGTERGVASVILKKFVKWSRERHNVNKLDHAMRIISLYEAEISNRADLIKQGFCQGEIFLDALKNLQ